MRPRFTTADLRARADKLYNSHQGDTVAMLNWAADCLDAANMVIAEYREKERTVKTSAEQASYLKTRDCEHDWKESTTKGWENCMNCGAARVVEKAKRTTLNRSVKP